MTQLPRVLSLMKKSRRDLATAERVLDISPEQAARMGYMAAFHAAHAALLAVTGKEPKTHRGTRVAFGELVLKEERLGPELGRFIASAYESKDIADYQTEYDVDRASAATVIAGAREVLERVSAFLEAS
ncbi:MAG TPA: HEPN domain-containing protein [Rhizomicrobium sp.]|jgi:uncharacterized protein (UPF0332 family)|nr:HEPN domain-containing protein [Rhizomicrobium sp.]